MPEEKEKIVKNIGYNGAVLNVGNPGNKGGGRPASEIRKRCRGAFDENLQVAIEIAQDQKASKSDKLRALDLMAKYGLPAQLEVDNGMDLTPEERALNLKEGIKKLLLANPAMLAELTDKHS